MKDASRINDGNTATASQTGQAPERHASPPPRSEAAYLDEQAAAAKAAMRHTVDELKQSLKETADIKYWARRHPWASVGAAAAGGFVAAVALFSRSDEEHQIDEARRRRAPESADRGADEDRSKPSGILGAVTGPLFDIAKTVFDHALMALVGTGVAAKATEDELEEVEQQGQSEAGLVERANDEPVAAG